MPRLAPTGHGALGPVPLSPTNTEIRRQLLLALALASATTRLSSPTHHSTAALGDSFCTTTRWTIAGMTSPPSTGGQLGLNGPGVTLSAVIVAPASVP